MGVVIPGGGYSEDRASGAVTLNGSLRFNNASTHYLSRTPGSAGNRRKFTCSVWVKRTGILASLVDVPLMDAGPDSTNFGISGTGALGSTYDGRFYIRNGGANLCKIPNALFRDPTAWYHFVFAVDTENGTAADRQILYVNGVRQENFDGSFTQNTDTAINNTVAHSIGANVGPGSSGYHGNMYLSEYNFIDGQALTPSSFGFTDPLTNTWRPKKYTGIYGTNGFYLPLDNNDAKGTDRSGNNNNWTANNFTGTFSNPDVVPDSPSGISYSTDSVSGITTVSQRKPTNWCTWNPLSLGADSTLSDGNLQIAYGGSATRNATMATMGMSSGKWYWENTITATSITNSTAVFGITNVSSSSAVSNYPGFAANGWGYSGNDGFKYNNGTGTSFGAVFGLGDVIGCAFDADNGKIWWSKNGTWQASGDPVAGTNAAYSSLASTTYYPAIGDGGSTQTFTAVANFGQKPFKYAPPEGFKTLCLANLPRPSKAAVRPDKYFNTVLYSGTSVTNRITGVGFQPDFVWVKKRSNSEQHELQDSVRGATKRLASNLTDAETTVAGSISSFDRDGFTVVDAGSTNESPNTYVAWCWKAGGAAVSNTDGSITSQVSANRDSGFSIVSYDSNPAGTVGHGLGVAPKLIIEKKRDASSDWLVSTTVIDGSYDYLRLNQTDAKANAVVAAPTSEVFTPNATSDSMIAYCFSEVAGYSKFGSYTGNGSADGPFVFCGFRPRWVILKRTDSLGAWDIHDAARDPDNVVDQLLEAQNSNAEASYSAYSLDFVSNGFKLRGNGASQNASGGTFIFAAFAEAPTQNLFGGQANAR